MGLYNTIFGQITCPRCHNEVQAEAETHLGYCRLFEYRIGDTVQWQERKTPKNGGRPPDGSITVEGYVECPVCRRDFWVLITVDHDVIVDINVTDRAGYILNQAALQTSGEADAIE